MRVVKFWNTLTRDVVEAPQMFKVKPDRALKSLI